MKRGKDYARFSRPIHGIIVLVLVFFFALLFISSFGKDISKDNKINEKENELSGSLNQLGIFGSAGDDYIIYQCGEINSSGVFYLNQSIYSTGDCLNITSDNVTINGNGYLINSSLGNAINLINNRINITIENTNIYSDFYGIYSNDSYLNGIIMNNTITSVNKEGVYVFSSLNLLLDKNNFYSNGNYNFNLTSIVNLRLLDQKIDRYDLNVVNISFENSNYGLIFYNSIIGNGNNLIGNSTSDIVIGSNSAYVNANRTSLNNSAEVILYVASGFVNRTILRDNVGCNSSTNPSCFALSSLDTDRVRFNVSSWSSYSLSTGVDVEIPVVLLTYPLNDDIFGGESRGISFKFNVSDNSNIIKKCNVYLNDELAFTSNTINNGGNEITGTVNKGSYSCYVKCYDNNSNSGNSLKASFSIDPDSPVYGGDFPIYAFYYDNLEKEFDKSFMKNWGFRFRLNNVFYRAIIKDVGTSSIIVNWISLKSDTTININEEKKFDVDNNGNNDISLKLMSISNKKAVVHVKILDEKVVVTPTSPSNPTITTPANPTNSQPVSNTPRQETPTNEENKIFIYFIIGFIGITGLIGIFFLIALVINIKRNKMLRGIKNDSK